MFLKQIISPYICVSIKWLNIKGALWSFPAHKVYFQYHSQKHIVYLWGLTNMLKAILFFVKHLTRLKHHVYFLPVAQLNNLKSFVVCANNAKKNIHTTWFISCKLLLCPQSIYPSRNGLKTFRGVLWCLIELDDWSENNTNTSKPFKHKF